MQLGIGLVLFMVVDAIVMVFVIRHIMARRAAAGGSAGLAEITRFASTAAEEAKRYLEANYSGDPGMLAGVMQGLVNRLAERAREQGITLDRAALKHVAGSAVIAIKAAKQGDVTAALESVG